MTADDLFDHDIRMFGLDRCGDEIVLPKIDRTAEVLGQKRHQLGSERIAEDDRSAIQLAAQQIVKRAG